MVDIEWKPLPSLWPTPAVWRDVGEFMLLVFISNGVPTWELQHKPAADSRRYEPIARGTADAFEAAKAAAVFEAMAREQFAKR